MKKQTEGSWLNDVITDGRKNLKKLQDTDMHEILVKVASEKIKESVEAWLGRLELANDPLNNTEFSNFLISNTAAYSTTLSVQSLISDYGMMHHSYKELVEELGEDGRLLPECEKTFNDIIPGVNVMITDVTVKMDQSGYYSDITFAVTIMDLKETPAVAEHFSTDKCKINN